MRHGIHILKVCFVSHQIAKTSSHFHILTKKPYGDEGAKTIMKKTLALFALSCLFFSCNKETPTTQEKQVNYVKVGLSFGGEITTSESPLTKADAPTDLYGINIYKSTDNGASYSNYAYGLFNDVSSVSIELPDDGIYKFSCRMIKDGVNLIDRCQNGNTICYSNPFKNNHNYGVAIDNKFIVSNDFLDFYSSVYYDPDNEVYYHAPLSSYYGVINGFDPTKASSVTINLIKTNFGVKAVATNLENGSIYIDIDGAPRLTIAYPSSEVSEIFTFTEVAKVPDSANYSETINCKFYWQKDENTAIALGEKDITFVKDKLTTINITITASTVDTSVGFVVEDNELGEGETVDFSGSGSGVDTDVNIQS